MRMITTVLVLILLNACVYRQDILQGNIIKASDVNKVEIGMSKDQVRFVLGTPMIQHPFDDSRWDYLLYVDSQEPRRNRYNRVSMWFDGEFLVRIEKIGYEQAGDETETAPRASFQDEAEPADTPADEDTDNSR